MGCRFGSLLLAVVGLVFCVGAGAPTTAPSPTTIPADVEASFALPGPLLLHLPGVGGYLRMDYEMLSGLREGGVDARLKYYDWTGDFPGIRALQAYQDHQVQAQKVAEMLEAHIKADPKSPVYLIGHSGGTGIAVYALAKLPKGMQIDTLLLLAPALSPTYDLSAALAHVKGHVYVFSSTLDQLILSSGTRAFGTIDGVRTDAAGFNGFVRPPKADAKLYAKIVAEPYREQWMKYGDLGDHIGTLHRRFSRAILAPLLKPVGAGDVSTTQPGDDSGGQG